MKKLDECKELVGWIGESRHDTPLSANIEGLTECLPDLIIAASFASARDRKTIERTIENIAACVCALRDIAEDIFE